MESIITIIINKSQLLSKFNTDAFINFDIAGNICVHLNDVYFFELQFRFVYLALKKTNLNFPFGNVCYYLSTFFHMKH